MGWRCSRVRSYSCVACLPKKYILRLKLRNRLTGEIVVVCICLLPFKSESVLFRRGAPPQPSRQCWRQSLAGAVGPGGMRWKWNARVVLAPAPRGRSTRHAPASSANLVVRVVVMISLHKYCRKLWAAKAMLNTSSPGRVFSAACPGITSVQMATEMN